MHRTNLSRCVVSERANHVTYMGPQGWRALPDDRSAQLRKRWVAWKTQYNTMGMIQQIINDAKAMEAEAIRSEEDAQKVLFQK